MSNPTNEGLWEISGLLFGAKERRRSARAVLRHTVDANVAGEANRRYVDWSFEQEGGSGLAHFGYPGPPEPWHFYHDYEDSEETVHIWHESPDRWREESRTTDNLMFRCVVASGGGGERWVYEAPDTALYLPSEPTGEHPDTDFSFILDPSKEGFYYALLDDATVGKTGRTATVAGREVVEVRVGTISWGYLPWIFNTFGASLEGTTDHLLYVDAEVGTLLRVAARLEGRDFRVAEVTEIAYDEDFPEDIFRLDLPGVEFRRMDR